RGTARRLYCHTPGGRCERLDARRRSRIADKNLYPGDFWAIPERAWIIVTTRSWARYNARPGGLPCCPEWTHACNIDRRLFQSVLTCGHGDVWGRSDRT